MRYRLKTLLVLLAVGAAAGFWNVTAFAEEITQSHEVRYLSGSDDPAPAQWHLTGEKTLNGAAADGYVFLMTDREGNVAQVVSQGGKIRFPTFTYQEAGEYTYTITEALGSQEGVVYDSGVYTVTVRVERQEDRYAVADVSIRKNGEPAAAVSFENRAGEAAPADGEARTERPEASPAAADLQAQVPRTGDGTAVWERMVLLSGAGLACLACRKKKPGDGSCAPGGL